MSPDLADAQPDQGLPPWQFFLLCGMLGATAVVIVATGQAIANILILSAIIIAASFAGLAAYRMLLPLVAHTVATAPVVAGGRTRAALEREKSLALRAIKELEFDFAMGKLSQSDYDEMGGRLRRRAMRLIQQLDANAGYREQIETELAAMVAASAPAPETSQAPPGTRDSAPGARRAAPGTDCPSCHTLNDIDARFCKQCGTSLATS